MKSPLVLAVLAFAGWCAASAVWSDLPSMTLRRVGVFACLLVAAFGLVRQLSPREWLHLAWMIPAGGLVVGLSAEVVLGTFRPWSAGYRFSGTLHPNTQGLSLAAMCFATFCLARENGWRKCGYVSLFAFGLLFIVLTKSRTSFAGVVVAITLLLTLRTASGVKWSVGMAALWAVSLAAVAVSLLNIDVEDQLTQAALLGRKEQAESLTGRMPIWTTLAEHVAQRPLVGYGYDSFWTPDRIETVSSDLHWGIREAHSAYIDTVLGVGLVGGLLVLTAVFLGLRSSSEQYLQCGHPLFGFVFAMLVFGLINACTESGMTMPLFVPFLTAAALLETATVSAARHAFQPGRVDGRIPALGLALSRERLRTLT
jgi:O-antigen ligase